MSASSRILQYLEYKGISKYRFYKETGLSNGMLDKSANIGSDKCEIIISHYADLSAEWLITGRGDMLRNLSSEGFDVHNLSNKKNIDSLDQEIPLYDVSAAAGCVMLFQDTNGIVPVDTIKIPNLAKCDGAIFARGDSMYPIIKSGDIILYKIMQGLETIMWGETYIICYELYGDYYTVVKYVKKSTKEEGNIVLLSQNEHHQPFEIHISQVKSMALVRASVRYNNM